MKRFFSFLVLAVLFTSCDDGDMKEVSFEFDESSANPCGNNPNGGFFLYKTTDQRALIIELDESNFTTTLTTDSLGTTPITLDIPSESGLIYRVYNDNITTTTICSGSGIPASYPIVTEERSATGGTIFISTTPIKTEIQNDGSNKISQYQHTITFKDITFNTTEGDQRFESLPTITYLKEAPSFFAFDNLNEVLTCADDLTLLYKHTNNQALLLHLSAADVAALFSNDISAPKQRPLNAENSLTHEFYTKTATTPLTDEYFCLTDLPSFPTLKETWKAEEGTNGIIEVVTEETNDENVYLHTIILRNVKMKKGNLFFMLKSEYILGTYEMLIP